MHRSCIGLGTHSVPYNVPSSTRNRTTQRSAKRVATSMFEQLHEGWSYVSNFSPIRTILTLFALLSLMGMPFMVLMPIFASQVFHGGPHTLGYLMGGEGRDFGMVACPNFVREWMQHESAYRAA